MITGARPDVVPELRLVGAGLWPAGLGRSHAVMRSVRGLIERHAREEVELQFGAPEALVCVPGPSKHVLSACRYHPRVERERFLGIGIRGGRYHGDDLVIAVLLTGCRGSDRKEHHVTALDGGESRDARAVKPRAPREESGGETRGGNGDVVPTAGQVDEAEIDEIDVSRAYQLNELLGVLRLAQPARKLL